MSIGNIGGLAGTALHANGLSGGSAADVVAKSAKTNAKGEPAPIAVGGSASSIEQVTVPQPSVQELMRVSADLQRKVEALALEIQFSVDQSTGRTLIEVTDRATSKVIRQIPSDEALQIGKQIDNFQRHLLLDQKA